MSDAENQTADVHEESEFASDEELLPRARTTKRDHWKRLSAASPTIIGIASGMVLVALCLMVVSSRTGVGSGPHNKISVRALLESDELATIATDNIMAIGSSEDDKRDRNEIFKDAKKGFKSVSDKIKMQTPAIHRKMDSIKLNVSQHHAVLRVLRKFSDQRMVGLTRDVVNAMSESRRVGADRQLTERRLMTRLAPRFDEVKRLSEEMYPGSTKLNLDLDSVPALHNWHGKLQVNLGRRLSSENDVLGIRPQARTLFRSLQGELGGEMPKATSRMLFSLDDIADDEKQVQTESFMDCLQKAVPNPMECVECASSHMPDVMSLLEIAMRLKS